MAIAAPRPTIADVARRAGVSIATVSRVINQTAPVSSAAASRVHSAITELHYVPQTAARSLASKRTHTLGLALYDIGDEFFAPLLRGVESALTEAGYDLLISTRTKNTAPGSRLPLGAHNTDGLLVFAESLSADELAAHHLAGLPMVLLYRSSPEGLSIPTVNIENRSGTRALIDHLIEHHHYHRIAFLRGPAENEDAQRREAGYREALAAHGLAVDEALIGEGGFGQATARDSIAAWLRAGLQFKAVFTPTDSGAMGAITALREAGLRVPEDVAVVGFDDLPLARYILPPLTTVRAPTERAGYEAAIQLVRLIREGAAQPDILLPTELVIRRSCGCDS